MACALSCSAAVVPVFCKGPSPRRFHSPPQTRSYYQRPVLHPRHVANWAARHRTSVLGSPQGPARLPDTSTRDRHRRGRACNAREVADTPSEQRGTLPDESTEKVEVAEIVEDLDVDRPKVILNTPKDVLPPPAEVAMTAIAGLAPKNKSGPFTLEQIASFAGLAPEITNGRVCMLGYVTVLAIEFTTGKGIVEQLTSGGWIWGLVLSVLITVGSIAPLLQGYTNDDWPGVLPFYTSKAERWNSRAAMFAFTLLVIVELVKGGPEVVQGGPIGL